MKKRMGESRTTDSPSDESLEFFKVYLPDFSSEHLCIPPDFVKQCGEIIPKKAILMDYTGKSWSVGIGKVENRLLIKNGWQDFAIHHSLEHGDFLLFRYDRSMVFQVKIFGKNGCKKKRASIVNRTLAVVKMEQQDEDNKAGERRTRPAHSCKRKLSNLNIRGMEMSGANGDFLFKPKQKSLKGGAKKYHVEPFIAPGCLHFVSDITQTGSFHVNIPSALIKQYHIDFKSEVILRDGNGKAWPVLVKVRKDGRTCLTTGWVIVRRSLGLKKGSRCIFEIVLGVGNSCSEMNVRVLPSSCEKLEQKDASS